MLVLTLSHYRPTSTSFGQASFLIRLYISSFIIITSPFAYPQSLASHLVSFPSPFVARHPSPIPSCFPALSCITKQPPIFLFVLIIQFVMRLRSESTPVVRPSLHRVYPCSCPLHCVDVRHPLLSSLVLLSCRVIARMYASIWISSIHNFFCITYESSPFSY